MSGESERALKNRARLSPDHAEIDEWMYDFTRDEMWRLPMLLGMMTIYATDNPKVSYWDNVLHAKQGLQQFTESVVSMHRDRHKILYQGLVEIVQDFVRHNATLPSTVDELMQWSKQQAQFPTEIRIGG